MRVASASVIRDPSHDKQATVGAIIVDAAIVRRHGADLGKATRILSGQFIKRAVCVEQVALGCNLAIHAGRPQSAIPIKRGVPFG